MKKMLGDIIILHKDTKNNQPYNVWFLRYWGQRTEFFVILEYFLPFYPLNNLKNQTFEKMKKIPGDIVILHKCTVNYNHIMYGSWDMKCDGQNFVLFWTAFCRFTPLATWKIKILKNWKKLMEISSFYTSISKIIIICYTVLEIWRMTDVIIFHFGPLFCTFTPLTTRKMKFKRDEQSTWRYHYFPQVYQNHDHMLYCSWYMAHDRCNCCFSFWAIFCPFTPLTAQKPKFLKNKKSTRIYHHFTYVYQNLWSGDVRFLRYGARQTDRRTKKVTYRS